MPREKPLIKSCKSFNIIIGNYEINHMLRVAFLHEVPGLADFPFFSSRNPRGFLEESSKIMHEEVGGVSSFRPPNW